MKLQEKFNALYHLIGSVPEIFLGIVIFFLAFVVLAFSEERAKKISSKTIIIASGTLWIMTIIYISIDIYFSTQLFIYDYYSYCMKSILAFLGFFYSLVLCNKYLNGKSSSILNISVLGLQFALMICISANNFMILFIGLELYAIVVAMMILFDKTNENSKKTASRYIINSAVIGAVCLYGMSLYYMSVKTLIYPDVGINFDVLSELGVLFILSYILFKIGAVPFHAWMSDVYESANSFVVMMLDSVCKMVLFVVFVHFSLVLNKSGSNIPMIMINISAVLSMFVGAISPFYQNNIKKFIAYSSIGHIGFALSAVCSVSSVGLKNAIIYVFSYCISSCVFFMVLICLGYRKRMEVLKDFTGISEISKICWYVSVFSLFSMCGLPPFFGFTAKFNIFSELIKSERYDLVVVGAIYSVLSVMYVLKILKHLFSKEKPDPWKAKRIKNAFFAVVIVISSTFILGSAFFPVIDKFVARIVSLSA